MWNFSVILIRKSALYFSIHIKFFISSTLQFLKAFTCVYLFCCADASPVVMDKPVCFIDTDSDGKLCVQQSALQILQQIQQPVVVVAVVGLYRTGKS